MTSLINFNKDKNTGVIYFPNSNKIRKFYLGSNPKKHFSNEINGIKWYNNQAEKIIDYYINLWPNETKVPSHGDLTFSNIIFNRSLIKFIDWENFNLNNFWGYDLCYFFMSIIFLPNIDNNKEFINNEELYIFEKLWFKVFKNRNFIYLKNPIKYLKDQSKSKNGNKKDKNFFINKVSEQKINQINEIIL